MPPQLRRPNRPRFSFGVWGTAGVAVGSLPNTMSASARRRSAGRDFGAPRTTGLPSFTALRYTIGS